MRVPIAFIVAVLVASAGCQPGLGTRCTAQIDWVDFVQLRATQYVASTTPASEGDLGPVIAHVKVKVAGSVCDPGYRPKDGDAAFLDVGTAIYALKGHPTDDAVVARAHGRLVVYEARPPQP